MKLLIVSDLHLDNGDIFGVFGWSPKDFIAKIDFLRSQFLIDRIVLNGDIFELCKYSSNEISAYNAPIIEYFNRMDAFYLRGNHDVAHPQGRNRLIIDNAKGEKILIEHGHKADFVNGTAIGRLIGKTFLKVLKTLVRFSRIRSLYFGTVAKSDCFSEFGKYDSFKYLRYALRHLKKFDVVVLGHTHKLEVHNVYYANRRKQYLNCGSCSLGKLQAIVLDTETLDHTPISLHPDPDRKPWSTRPQPHPILTEQ